MARLYAIKTPKGKLIDETLDDHPWDKFWWTYDGYKIGGEDLGEWELMLAAKRAGYKKVRVWLTEEKPG